MKKSSASRRILSNISATLTEALESGQIDGALYQQLVDLGMEDRRQEALPSEIAAPIPDIPTEPVAEPSDSVSKDLEPEVSQDAAWAREEEGFPAEEPPAVNQSHIINKVPAVEEPYPGEEMVILEDYHTSNENDIIWQPLVANTGNLSTDAETGKPTVVSTSKREDGLESHSRALPIEHAKDGETKPIVSPSQQGDSQIGGSKWSYLFTWCRGCLRVDAFASVARQLPDEIMTKTESQDGIVLIQCGTCRMKETHVDKPRPSTMTPRRSGWDYGTPATPKVEPSFQINPKAWCGTEASIVSRIITGREVPMITDKEGVTALFEAHTIFQSLKLGERAFSIDMERFRNGKQSGLELSHIEGGLL